MSFFYFSEPQDSIRIQNVLEMLHPDPYILNWIRNPGCMCKMLSISLPLPPPGNVGRYMHCRTVTRVPPWHIPLSSAPPLLCSPPSPFHHTAYTCYTQGDINSGKDNKPNLLYRLRELQKPQITNSLIFLLSWYQFLLFFSPPVHCSYCILFTFPASVMRTRHFSTFIFHMVFFQSSRVTKTASVVNPDLTFHQHAYYCRTWQILRANNKVFLFSLMFSRTHF